MICSDFSHSMALDLPNVGGCILTALTAAFNGGVGFMSRDLGVCEQDADLRSSAPFPEPPTGEIDPVCRMRVMPRPPSTATGYMRSFIISAAPVAGGSS